ncbi:tRNA threonylcarbamoyladenosine dehydratase [Acidaminobacter sp. JC074]|uniref:tRNA threonylcarbamoyladenosine dehydratase n=1 Tax=Acidaminobacter sp. JC074 TaxID=2530199 RepID=UPI001F1064A2|nr:tRNA threonylcarbamoyladenosine dehydratase [Acidaminobacter sp. JC074]MCH4886614.1 tRNA threonylcarbamoyladenosine dehydratase [Acidaminobacter sp. JC074]
MDNKFIRSAMLLGEDGIDKLKDKKVAVFGIGGVGSFVVEALARTGIGHIVLIDFDDIVESNINRQIHAHTQTVGQLKVEAMKERIKLINPDITVTALPVLFNKDNLELISNDLDYVVDAIDMVTSKLLIIERCKELDLPFICSMGTGNKLNPAMLEVADISKTSMCPLAKVMRNELKKRRIKKVKVVYSKEQPLKPFELETSESRRSTPGSVSFVPSVAGLIIASEVIKDILEI